MLASYFNLLDKGYWEYSIEIDPRTVELNTIALRPDRIACYNYAHLPERFTSQRAIDRLTLPTPDEKLLLHELISHTLQEAGYRLIGMDHYVLPDDEPAIAQQEGCLQRNFQGYSLHMADDLLGLGVSAISQMGDYYSAIDSGALPVNRGVKTTAEDQLRRHVIMRLISDLRLDLSECNERFGIAFNEKFATQLTSLQPLVDDGLLSISGDEVRIHQQGRPFLRNICMPFDAYLTAPKGDEPAPRFSATV